MSAIELDGVSKSFLQIAVLREIELSVPEGSRTVVVGSSGSGKTTLLRLISGFDFPDAGTITVSGRRVAGVGAAVPAHQRGIGVVAQDGALFPHLTVGENIAFGLGIRKSGGRASAVRKLLNMVSLDADFAPRRPDELSGGQQQRVALARALARRPKVMLLDEPFSALDAGLRAATREVVADTLAREGVTTVLVTHDQAEALSFADQLAVLREGRLTQVGSPRELYARPVDLFTARFLGDAVVLDATVEGELARCALGAVPIVPTPIRGDASIMFRPEQLAVGPAEADGCAGRVEAVEFYGSEVLLTIRLEGAGDATAADGVIRVRQRGTSNAVVGSRVGVTAIGPAIAYPREPVSAP
ncbi:ABC transporter ATP-binding protein [Cryobacterium tagatosivorans]|uniref:ABC-type quaternary amine transporter n=1 Tax=Cryobacterium tagatosivorans TaxID=1259199 RepID=A0A4R8UG72_9MICO|nr:ABC transporter ATP-binding protein [Cryobacterium tagatosivorans]TFB52309.1 ABC transporter ATP-binding protein [Cryobacterium tagatosivorans]